MIKKVIEINKNIFEKENFFLFYGPNEGLKNEKILKLLLNVDKNNIYKYEEKEILNDEITFFNQVFTKSLFEERHIQNVIKKSHANIVTVSPDYFVIEKTGFRHETEDLRIKLVEYGLLQFVRSGRISVTKSKMGISDILNTFKDSN